MILAQEWTKTEKSSWHGSLKTSSYGDASLQDLQEDYQLYIIWLCAFYTKIMIKIFVNNIFNSTSLLKVILLSIQTKN